MTRKWKGLRIGTNDKLPVHEHIAREKDAAYVYMQLGNVSEMVKRLSTVARMQDNLSALSGKETPAFYDFESMRRNASYYEVPVYAQQDNFGNNF